MEIRAVVVVDLRVGEYEIEMLSRAYEMIA